MMLSGISESEIKKSVDEIGLLLQMTKAKSGPQCPSYDAGNIGGSVADSDSKRNGEMGMPAASSGGCVNSGKNVVSVTSKGYFENGPNGIPVSMPLREWIAQAQRILFDDGPSLSDQSGGQKPPDLSFSSPSDVNSANRTVVTSKAYLSAALKIGHSLAAQLLGNRESESSDERISCRAPSSSMMSPGLNCLKSEQVLIELSSSSEFDFRHSDIFDRPMSPLEFKMDVARQNGSENIKNLNIQEEFKIDCSKNVTFGDVICKPGGRAQLPRNFSFSDFSVESVLGKESGSISQPSKLDRLETKSLFDISGAHFIAENPCSEAVPHSNRVSKDEKYEIHTLGLVFYELFSGGMRYPARKLSSSGSVHDEKLNASNDLQYEQLAVAERGVIDLSSTLKLFNPDDLLSGATKLGHRLSDTPTEDSSSSDEQGKLISLDGIGNGVHLEKGTYRKKKSRFIGGITLALDPLKSQQIPTVICDMITNMIDSINGDLSGEDAYNSMDDVRNDITWMMENLNGILNNVDPNKIITRGLQIDNLLCGRESEMAQLMEAYQKSLSGVSLALISGSSGTGKSQLAKQIALHSCRLGGELIFGKYDQLQQAKPFSAISFALNEYCGSLTQKLAPESIESLASKTQERIGSDGINVLSKLIPNLIQIFEPRGIVNAGQDGCVNAQKRIHYFLGHFVEVISTSSPAGLTLFLDDLQWADSSSIHFIHQLLLRFQFDASTTKRNFFFLGCFRDGEVGTSFQNWIKKILSFGINVTRIHLKGMDRKCVNTVMSDIFCLPPRLTRPLSDVVHFKTQGNHLFVNQLLKSLHKEGLIFVCLKRRRWDWEIERINARGISDDVAMVLSGTINSLPQSVKEALCIVSCFGASLEQSLAQVLERHLGITLSNQLETLVKEGLLDKRGGDWYFVHDKVQEAAYNEMKPEDRYLHHFDYGLSLSSVALEERNDDMLIKAVDQINRGGPTAVSDRSQTSTVAELNLKAGNISVDRSDFSTAFSFYDHGISFLRKGHWKEHYDLSLELHTQAAHCALVVADFSSLSILSDQVIANATSFDDKLPVMYAQVQGLEVVSKFPEAIEKGLSVLDQLGVNILDRSSSWKTDGLLEETASMLLRYRDRDILSLGKMEDPRKIMTMKFLGRMQFLLGLAKPTAQPVATMTMVQLSLRFGLSSLSPVAFVLYGSLLGVLGEIQEGYRYVKVGLQLLDSKDLSLTKEAASETYVLGSQVMSYIEPHQSLIDFIFRAHEIGLETGDTNSAMLCLLFQSACAYWGGKNLKWTRSSVEDSLKLMKQYNNITWMTQLLPLYRSVLSMVGVDEGIETLMGKCCAGKETEQETALLKHNAMLSKFANFNKMYVAFMFRRYSETKRIAEDHFHHLDFFAMLLCNSSHTFYEALVSFWIARNETLESGKIWLDRGERAMSDMKRWSDSCSWNFSHKLNLLEAEKHYCMKDVRNAKLCYEASISSAATHKFVHEEALACELAGYFFIDIGEPVLAMSYFMRSHERYQSWGAFAKANSLFQHITSLK